MDRNDYFNDAVSQCGVFLALDMRVATSEAWDRQVQCCLQYINTQILSTLINYSNELSLSIGCWKYFTDDVCVMDCLLSHNVLNLNKSYYVLLHSLPRCDDGRKVINLVPITILKSVHVGFSSNQTQCSTGATAGL